MGYGTTASRRRQAGRKHATRTHQCPRCGRLIRGNGYYGHKKACKKEFARDRPENFIPMELFGKDHWSTFAYLETRCVDHDGMPDRSHMRTDPDLHPGLGHTRGGLPDPDLPRKKYPTRLNNGTEIHDHDDWNCVEDLEAAGLLKWEGTGMYPIFVLTDKGKTVAGRLRAYKSNGGAFHTFKAGSI